MKPQLFNEYHTLASLIAEINEYDAADRNRLAGYYAYDAASDKYSDDDALRAAFGEDGDAIFTAHLDVLAENGCRFDAYEALMQARQYTHADKE